MNPLAWAFLIDSVPFTPAVIAGETSLGGSESACLGLARALRARGHDIHLFATKLDPAAAGMDATGITWHPFDDFRPMNEFIEWDVVVSLRMWHPFLSPMHARLRLLWNQDLLVPGAMVSGVMAVAWAIDHLCYVSQYHRDQWEDLNKELTPIGWVTRNGIDRSQVPTGRTKAPHRIIHVSRPERGLGPLLTLWPKLREQVPDAELQICRYSSMYDQGQGSWTDVCAAFDRRVEDVNRTIGGITYLGELTKPQLYQAIADAAVMWYPGVAGFAETSCIAATEANACGTPFVGSLRGALVETAKPSYEAGLLFSGEAGNDPEYAERSVEVVAQLLAGCRNNSFQYRKLCQAGQLHAASYDYAIVAAEWDAQVQRWFTERYEAGKIGVLRQLLHEDDHVAAKYVAETIYEQNQQARIAVASKEGARSAGRINLIGHVDPLKSEDGLCDKSYQCVTCEAICARDFCDYVIAGKDQTSDNYAERAIADPLLEAEHSDRFKAVGAWFDGKTSVLDIACGNGSFAIALTKMHPTIRVHGLDYAQGNIDRARDGADRAGVGDRCTFERLTVYDFDAQCLAVECDAWLAEHPHAFDGLFVGEFIEHVGNHRAVIDGLEVALQAGATVAYTCPHGACAELVPRNVPLRRGHVHRFHHDDVKAVWGVKEDFSASYLSGGTTERGHPLGNWMIRYTMAPDRPAGARPIADRIRKTRPLQKLSVGIIAKDAENDLGRCLASIYKIADEIVVGDTGSTDTTKAIAASYGAHVLDLDPIDRQREGFAGARNAVLDACTGDWFLWIDTDEQLIDGWRLRAFLDGMVYHGYVLHQTHVYLDGPATFDVPNRLFRRTPSVRFYGCVHEQPQDGDPNTDIQPALDLPSPLIAHLGYLTPDGREEKRVGRNKPLLLRDQQVFSDRLLGKVLLLREATIEADLSCARAGGELTPRAAQGYQHAIQIFARYFDDPAHKFTKIARPWYEAALRHLGQGWEAEISLFGKPGGLNGARAKPEFVWVRDADEFSRLMAHRTTIAADKMRPVTFKTEPFGLPADASQTEAVS